MKNAPPTEYRKTLKQKILVTAMNCFKQKGIKAVRMDDIANELSISKRTLYEIFNNKEQLLYEGVIAERQHQREEMLEFVKKHDDVMQIIIHFYHIRFQELGSVNPLFFTEISKYKQVADYIHVQQEEQLKNRHAFFMRGVREGYFLPQLNYEVVPRLGEAVMSYIMSAEIYQQYTLQEVFRNFVSVILRGCCTEKGKKMLDESL